MDDQSGRHSIEAVSVDAFARLVELGRSTIYRALSPDATYRRGLPHLPSVKVGRARRIRLEDGHAWLKSMTEVA